MDRRKFIRNSALASAGSLFLTNGLLAGCKDNKLPDGSNFQGKVIVVGAGAAGLYAGWLLKERGIPFSILEASGQYGGRLGKVTDFASFPIDTGAQWLHGKRNVAGDLIKKAGIAITEDNGEPTYWFNSGITADLPRNLFIFEGSGFPDVSFWDYAQSRGLGDEYRFLVEALAGDYGAAADELSVFFTNLEEINWSSGSSDYKFEATYFDFLESQFAAVVQDNLQLNTPVVSIDYSADQIILTDAGGTLHYADKVILTVPITVLKDGDIDFVPTLPAQKRDAFARIGMGPGMKVFLRFTSSFYDPYLIGGQVCAAYLDDSFGKTTPDHVLLAFIMGDQATQLNTLPNDEAIIAALLAELDSMYAGQASANFVEGRVFNWTQHPYIRGAYSFSTIGMGDARSEAAASLDNKLFFAGEAMNLNGHHQTVQGALETAERELANILNNA